MFDYEFGTPLDGTPRFGAGPPVSSAADDNRTRRRAILSSFDMGNLTSARSKRERLGSGPITNVVPPPAPRSSSRFGGPLRLRPRLLYAKPDDATGYKRSRPDTEHISYGGPGMSGAVGRYSVSRAGRARSYTRQYKYAKRLDRGPSVRYQRLHQPMRGFLGPAGDQKYVDVAFGAYAMSTTGAITHISIVPQGTTVNTREGKAFQVSSVQVRGQAQSGSTTAVAMGSVYWVWDFQPNKALAAITDVLDTANANSFIKRENASRFKMIAQRHYSFTGTLATPATGNEQFTVEEFLPLPSLASIATCTVADTTGAIGNRVTGALLMITVGDTATGTAAPNLNVGIRVNFRDI